MGQTSIECELDTQLWHFLAHVCLHYAIVKLTELWLLNVVAYCC